MPYSAFLGQVNINLALSSSLSSVGVLSSSSLLSGTDGFGSVGIFFGN